jgi:uncharacterized protein (DUF433 family)
VTVSKNQESLDGLVGQQGCERPFRLISLWATILPPRSACAILTLLRSTTVQISLREVNTMQLEDYFDFLAPDEIRLKGHRIGIEDVLYEHIYNELTPPQLTERFPTLSAEQLYATILYYLRNRARLDAYLAAWLEHGEQRRAEQAAQPTPMMQKLRQLRATLTANA